MTTRDQDQQFDLEQFQRSLKLLMPDPSDEGALEIMRMYLPVANGDTQPNPALMPALESVAGGSLCVGIMPVRTKGGVSEKWDLRWCRRLVGAAEVFSRGGQFPWHSTPEGQWLGSQRQSRSNSVLSPERQAVLDAAIPGWFEAYDPEARFEAALVRAVEAFRRDGRLPKQVTPEGVWLRNQRQNLKNGRLSNERKAMLDAAIPGWLDIRGSDALFEAALARSVEAFRKDGQLPEGPTIEGNWIIYQRQNLKNGRLPTERKVMLDEALPGWFEAYDPDAQFEAALARAVEAFIRDGQLPKCATPEGWWLTKQRRGLKNGRLSTERKAMLDKAIPGWFEATDPDAQFEAALTRAADTFQREGRLPKTSTPEGNWLNSRRRELRNGRLSTERKAMLDKAIPGWFEAADPDARFEAALARAVEAFRRDGQLPKYITPEGSWLAKQRQGIKNGKLPTERKAMLDEALPGWFEATDPTARFEAALARAVEAFRRDGQLPKYITPEGSWLNDQRQSRKKGRLSTERKAMLDAAIPGWLEERNYDTQFEAALARAVEAFRRDGQLPRKSTPEGPWLVKQRRDLRNGRLSTERKAKLDAAIPGWFEATDPDARFEAALARAVEAFRRDGQLPKTSTPEGSWLSSRRQELKKGRLSTERQAMLDAAIPGWHAPKP